MKFSFASLLGTVPRGTRTLQLVTTAGVLVKNKECSKLNIFDQLKQSKSTREGGIDKFSFIQVNGEVGRDFKTVYGLHMRIEAPSKN